ncbi:ABC transporter permease [Lacimicrobium sp. SS2-24]|uniref:ABC transporter permease n=1 Tax=Lacimicrobium sp. SS2-24 TaxID=2005569 RepID=UPI000B4AF56F|nr:ABC transporter permease [Lacimicrobium sp. SS2-24]
MISYYLKLGLLSLKRNPMLSALMILAIGLGVGACMTVITVNYLMSADPIPHKSEQLFYVQLDSWDPHATRDERNLPPDQLTWTDATNLMAAGKAKRQSAMASSGAVVEPQGAEAKPFNASIRLAYTDFFPMFDVPFLYGSPWSAEDDRNERQVVVLSKAMNDKIFGGINSVGESLRIAGTLFTVVGVLDSWQPVPRFYDLTTGAFNTTEDLFMPLSLKMPLELDSSGNVNCWKEPEQPGFKGFLLSECVNFQMWVELDNEQAKADYLAFLDNYANAQKELGRFPRPLNNRLSDVMTWLEIEEVVADDARIMLWLSFMFLAVCLLNTIALLLAKFSAKAPEIGLRRAIGASRRDIFVQHLLEAGSIGILGGVLGLGLALLGLQGIGALYGEFAENLTSLDVPLVLLALALALLASILAGLYPTWRACQVNPSQQLKSQ